MGWCSRVCVHDMPIMWSKEFQSLNKDDNEYWLRSLMLPVCLYYFTTTVYVCVLGKHIKKKGVAHSAWAEVEKTVNTQRENGRTWHIKLIVCACGRVYVCTLLCICVLCVSTCWIQLCVCTCVCACYAGDSYVVWPWGSEIVEYCVTEARGPP